MIGLNYGPKTCTDSLQKNIGKWPNWTQVEGCPITNPNEKHFYLSNADNKESLCLNAVCQPGSTVLHSICVPDLHTVYVALLLQQISKTEAIIYFAYEANFSLNVSENTLIMSGWTTCCAVWFYDLVFMFNIFTPDKKKCKPSAEVSPCTTMN